MIQHFLGYIKEQKIFDREDDLLLGLSGGADSIALFHLLRKGLFKFSVAHVNYALRGDESDGDEAFVREECAKYDIPCYVYKVSPTHWNNNINIQAEARSIRYRFFKELVDEHGFKKILTAHHKDDNIETILMNITRGTGIEGLTGIAINKNNISRPLLAFSRLEIKKYLEENSFEWREDASNASSKYRRNRFRNEIIPLLKDENPALHEAFDRLIENMSIVNDVYADAFDVFTKKNIQKKDQQIIIKKQQASELKKFLFHFLRSYGFNRGQVKDMITALPNIGKEFESQSHSVFIDRNDLILVPKEAKDTSVLEIVENASALLHPIRIRFSKADGFVSTKNANIAQFDKAKLDFPLFLRSWQQGDRMQPLGMKGTKKVSDILIDKKISKADKQNVYVLISGDDIIWIPGIQMSEKGKVDSDSDQIWRAEIC